MGLAQSIFISPGLVPWLKASDAGPGVVCAWARAAGVAGDSPMPVTRALTCTLYQSPTLRFCIVCEVAASVVVQEPLPVVGYVATDSSL